MLLKVDHVDRLLLPWLLGLFETKELVEDILMRYNTSIVPLCFSLLSAGLPLHLFLDLFGAHISGLVCAFGDLFISPHLTGVCAAAFLLKY